MKIGYNDKEIVNLLKESLRSQLEVFNDEFSLITDDNLRDMFLNYDWCPALARNYCWTLIKCFYPSDKEGSDNCIEVYKNYWWKGE